MDELFELIQNSRITLIGYSYKLEPIKESILLKLMPIKIDPNNMRAAVRDVKLYNLIHGYKEFVSIDTNDIRDISGRMKVLENFCENFIESNKIIITSPVIRNFENNGDEIRHSNLYMSDLAIIINDFDTIKIIKNRYSGLSEIEYDAMDIMSKGYLKSYETIQ